MDILFSGLANLLFETNVIATLVRSFTPVIFATQLWLVGIGYEFILRAGNSSRWTTTWLQIFAAIIPIIDSIFTPVSTAPLRYTLEHLARYGVLWLFRMLVILSRVLVIVLQVFVIVLKVFMILFRRLEVIVYRLQLIELRRFEIGKDWRRNAK